MNNALTPIIERVFGETVAVATRISRHYWRNIPPFDTKDDSSPVTVADKEIEGAIRAILKKHTPSFGIYGEEFGIEGIDNEYVWVIDPIDGTKGFLVGGPMFTNMLALAQYKKPIAGLVNVPIMGEVYTAIDGIARCNGLVIHARACADIGAAVGFFSAPDMRYSDHQYDIINKLRVKTKVHRACYDSYAYCLMARGLCDLGCEMGMEAYDRMALAPLLSAAGGIMTNWRGEAVSLDSGTETLAAGDKGLHQKMLSLL